MDRELSPDNTSLSPPSRLLDGLNDVQKQAVTHFGPPLLILAGAGSGKTRVITHKIAHIIESGRCPAHKILAVTFTNKAAQEMRGRTRELSEQAQFTRLSTFHSYGAAFLRRNTEAANLSPNFSIYDDSDSVALLRTLYPHDEKRALRGVFKKISRAKNYALMPGDDLTSISTDPIFSEYYRRYQERLREIGNVDFGDLILLPLQLISKHAHLLSDERERISVLLIDEYQDTNRAQSLLVSRLFHPSMYLCAVGDDDQSIYGFRGAEVEHIVNFPDRYANSAVMHLEQNYRSTGHILTLASYIVNQNRKRQSKRLWTALGDGMLPLLTYYESDYREARGIVARIRDDWRQTPTAILYRINAQSRIFESELLRHAIPYQIVGSLRFYEREEVKDIVAFLKLIANDRDEISLRRIINKPARGIGAASEEKIIETAKLHHGGNLHALFQDPPATMNARVREGCRLLASIIDHCLKILAVNQAALDAGAEGSERIADMPAADAPLDGSTPPPLSSPPDAQNVTASLGGIVNHIADASNLRTFYQESDQLNGTTKVQNINELSNAASVFPATYTGLVGLLQRIELESAVDRSEENNKVTLITMHNTKGLEYERVFVTGLQDGLMPHSEGLDQEKIEEERRLMYVAITRAKRALFLSTYRYRHMHGKMIENVPSRFLNNLQEERYISVEQQEYYDHSDAGAAAHNHGQSRRTIPGGEPDAYRQQSRAVNQYDPAFATDSNRETAQPRRHLRNPDGFTLGDTVAHDDYGIGEIIKQAEEGEYSVISVRFQSGRVAKFIEKYAALDRVASD